MPPPPRGVPGVPAGPGTRPPETLPWRGLDRWLARVMGIDGKTIAESQVVSSSLGSIVQFSIIGK